MISQEENNDEVEDVEEASELAALIDQFDACRGQGEFPEIEPNGLKDVNDQEHAEHTLGFIRKVETIEILSYLDHCCQEYFEAHPVCVGTEKMAVRMSRWKRDFSYTHIRNFFMKKFTNFDTLSHRFDSGIFLPLLPIASLQNRKIAQSTSTLVQTFLECDLPVFEDRLRKKWNIIKNALQ